MPRRAAGRSSPAFATSFPMASRSSWCRTSRCPPKFDQFPGAPSPTAASSPSRATTRTESGRRPDRRLLPRRGATRNVTGGQASPTRGIRCPPTPYRMAVRQSSVRRPRPAPPAGKMVFTGLDVEAAPTAGGIFMAPLTAHPTLTTIAGFQPSFRKTGPTPRRPSAKACPFDGRYVGFWGALGYRYLPERRTPVPDRRQRGSRSAGVSSTRTRATPRMTESTPSTSPCTRASSSPTRS